MKKVQKLILSMALIILMPLSFANNNIEPFKHSQEWTATVYAYGNRVVDTFDIIFAFDKDVFFIEGKGLRLGLNMEGKIINNEDIKITFGHMRDIHHKWNDEILLTNTKILDGNIIGEKAMMSFETKRYSAPRPAYIMILDKKQAN